jgi:response regulator NasT
MRLKVMVIDESAGRAALLERALTDAGYEIIARIEHGVNLLERVNEVKPDVIIIDMEMPDRDTLEQLYTIHKDQPRPIVMFADNSESDVIEAAVKAGVSAYVVDGLNPARVKPIMDVAIARFREFQALREELEQTKSTLAERKVIDKAKGIIMKQRGVDEAEAYKSLRKMAMDSNKRISEIAKDVIAIAELLGS